MDRWVDVWRNGWLGRWVDGWMGQWVGVKWPFNMIIKR